MDATNRDDERPADPGLRGGPGTLRGVDYQIQVAILRAVRLIRRYFGAPHLPLMITVERLVALEDGATEKWDVVAEPPRERIEAKVNPSAADVREWLETARAVMGVGATFVYGRERGATLGAMVKLKQRSDASANQMQFDLYVSGHASKAEKELLAILGDDSFSIVQAIRLEHLPEELIDDFVFSTAEPFAGAEGARRLVEMLRGKFLAGGSSRRPFVISELVDEARKRGITLVAPPFPNAQDLGAEARSALAVVQTLPAPVPAELLAAALRLQRQELEELLDPLFQAERLELRDGRVGIMSAFERVNDPHAVEVEGRLLASLLTHIEANSKTMHVDAQVDNAIQLAARREEPHPEVVAHVFRVLDKLLKRRGDWRLVFQVADRSIRAANNAQRSEEIVKDHAVALICGRSWAWQRRGDLAKARADGEESLRIGEAISWERNTAYCHKCLGRLRRLEGEQAPPTRRLAYFEKSVDSLKLAIDEFAEQENEPDVGDAYSLLGRTYLVAGRVDEAEWAIDEAIIRLTDTRDKDYMDLLVLRGDVANAGGRLDEARAFFDAAIDLPGSDAAKNEIRARALHQRGLNFLALGETMAARDDFVAASRICDAFDDVDGAAKLELEVLKVDGDYPDDEAVVTLLANEPPAVQVAAAQARAQALTAASPPGAQEMAARQTLLTWRTLITNARRDVERRRRSWYQSSSATFGTAECSTRAAVRASFSLSRGQASRNVDW